jgi:hypothetical protein
LSIGDHIIYVSGRDAANNWEATASIVITVSVPAPDAAGPLTTNATVKPKTATDSITLIASVSDATTGGSNIAAAELFVDRVGTNGSGIAMAASDGSFNEATETVTVSVNVASLSAGRHTVYIHGQDAAGNWGSTVSLNFRVKRGTRIALGQDEIEDDSEEMERDSDHISTPPELSGGQDEIEDDSEEMERDSNHITTAPKLSSNQDEIEDDREETQRESDPVRRSTELSVSNNKIEQSDKGTLRDSDHAGKPHELSASQNKIEKAGKEILRASERKDEGRKKEGEGVKRTDRSK